MQYIVVMLVIATALVFAAVGIKKRVGGFSPKKPDCGSDCGCGKN